MHEMQRTLPASILMLALATAAITAARETGALNGRVVDPFGDPLAGVDVRIESISGYRLTEKTDKTGAFNPPRMLGLLAASGSFLPRTGASFFNRGPTQHVGAEPTVDQRISESASISASYSWQGRPVILDAEDPCPAASLSLPLAHRVDAGAGLNGRRLIGSASVTTATRVFWSDVLTPDFHGYSAGYTTVNETFGVKWNGGAVTTLVKVTSLFNQSIQQHIFGDILRRTVIGEVRFEL